MTVSRRPARRRQQGQVMLLFALAMLVILGMVAVAVDGSFGFIQLRRAQNAADFAAFASAQQLNGSQVCNGSTATPTMQKMVQIVQDTVDGNAPAVGTSWTGQFLDSLGRVISSSSFTSASSSSSTYPPPGACGVQINASPAWKPYLAGVLGVQQLTGQVAGSVASKTTGSPISIVELNKVGPHAVLGGGSGNFIVVGDMFLNTQVTHQPWTAYANGYYYNDAVDAKSNSNLFVFGTIHSNNATYNDGTNGTKPQWPLDGCFGTTVGLQGNGVIGAGVAYNAGDPPPDGGDSGDQPTYSPPCSEGGVTRPITVSYNHIDPTFAPINDPLQGGSAPPDPTNNATAINCPGQALLTDPASTTVSGVTTYKPGRYTTPVHITTKSVFGDCSAIAGEAAYPGIYRFDKGLWIDPRSSSATVTGSNVVLSTISPYPVAGNVPGTVSGGVWTASGAAGNGAPCLPDETMSSVASGNGTATAETDGTSAAKCAGATDPTDGSESNYGTIIYDDSSFNPVSGVYGTGENYSLMIGGVSGSSVTLTGPTTGTYGGAGNTPGLVLYQAPGTQANFAFNGLPADATTINVTGVVYDASLTTYGSAAPLQYWDATGGGQPLYAGGTLQTGNGAGWSSGGPTQSGGSFTVTGTCVVDQFNTLGGTTITIIGQPYALSGGGSLSLIG